MAICNTLPESLEWVKCPLTAIRSHTTGRHTNMQRDLPLVMTKMPQG